MNSARPLVIAVGLILGGQVASAQENPGIEPTCSKAASIQSSWRVVRAPPMQKRSTSGPRKYRS